MIYRNDNIEVTNDYIRGTIKDLKEYFRYQIASLCMTGDTCNYEVFSNDVRNIMELLDNLYEDTNNDIFSNNDIMTVKEQPMGGFMLESER